MKGIVRFLTDTKIEWRATEDKDSRCDAFDQNDKKNTTVLNIISN